MLNPKYNLYIYNTMAVSNYLEIYMYSFLSNMYFEKKIKDLIYMNI